MQFKRLEQERCAHPNTEAAHSRVVHAEETFADLLSVTQEEEAKLFKNVTDWCTKLDAAVLSCATKWHLEEKNLENVVQFVEALRKVAVIMVSGRTRDATLVSTAPSSVSTESPRRTSVSAASVAEQVRNMRSKMGLDDGD